jgi:hypothetical protein
MQVIEIRYRGADLGAAMTQMRTWLDHHQAEPSLFEFVFLRAGVIRFRLQFEDACEASAFAKVFDGEVLSEQTEAAA